MPPVLLAVLATLVLTAAAYDIRYRRIPNWLTVSGFVLGMSLNGFLFFWVGLRSAGLGFGLAFLVYTMLYLARAMGAGDVKLMAAIGAIAGPLNWVGIFLATSVLGGLTALVLVSLRGRLRHTLWNVGFIVGQMGRMRAPYLTRAELDVNSPKAITLPHAAVIAVACLGFVGFQIWNQ